MLPISNIAKTPTQVNFQSQKTGKGKLSEFKEILKRQVDTKKKEVQTKVLNATSDKLEKIQEVLLKLVEAGGTKTANMRKEQAQNTADKKKTQIDKQHQSIKTSIITAIKKIAEAIQNIINDLKK